MSTYREDDQLRNPKPPKGCSDDGCDTYFDHLEAQCRDVPLLMLSSLLPFCAYPETSAKSIARKLTNRLPWAFSLLCFLLFATPIVLTYRIGQDLQVRYWISEDLHMVLVLPMLYLLTHWMHLTREQPHRILICICLVGSCAYLLLLADLVLLYSHRKATAIGANDCSTDMEKKALQQQWLNAQAFFQSCMAETATRNGGTVEAAYSLYRITDCEGYAAQQSANPGWPYLGALEEEYRCAGWCVKSQQALWTFQNVKDSCAMTVADVLFNKVQWGMLQVVVYATIVLVVVSICLCKVGLILRTHSIEW